MAARPNPRKVKVTGHGRVTVAGLRAAVRASKNVSVLAGSGSTSGGAAGDLGKRLKEAGVYVAGIAKGKASWSEQIPPKIRVGGGRSGVTVSCNAPPAYPNEIAGVRHPTFGHDPWVTNEHRPFLGPAADEGADGAAEIVARVIDDWAAEYGFK
jgi:hypothetical protein